MRILHAYKVFLPEISGGIPAVIATLLRIGERTENEVVVCRRFGPARHYVFDSALVYAAASIGTLFSTPLSPGFAFALMKRSRRAEIVVHHMPFPLTDIAIAFGLPKRAALVVYWHAEIVGRSALKKLVTPLIRRALERADRIVVSSDANTSQLLTAHRAKTAVVPYGIDTRYWMTTSHDEERHIERLRQDHPRLVIAIGRLVHYKGYDVLLKAVAMIDATLVIVGDGRLRSQLVRLAVTLGVADRVMFLGNLPADHMKVWLYAAKMLALPSRNEAEAFGIVQIEAMAAGRPVINTRLPTAVPTIARDGREGLTVEPEDAKALASAIDRLLQQPDLAAAMGAAGRTRAVDEYDEKVFLARMNGVYDDALRLHQDQLHPAP